MTTEDDLRALLLKAEENLAAAENDAREGRYNACASRCYYACFQVAVAALMQAGVRPAGRRRGWSHQFVQSQFTGQLIGRRKLYSASLRGVLPELLALRRIADYDPVQASTAQVLRALRDSRNFVAAVRGFGDRR